MQSEKFQKWKKSQILYGKPPLNIYRATLKNLSFVELDNLRLKTEAKESNILLIQKIYYWVLSVVSVGLISTGLMSLRSISDTSHLHQYLNNIATGFIIFAISYFILSITLLIIIQSVKNTVKMHLQIINEQLDIKKENSNNV